jgi:hypothetical protein
VGTEVVLDYEPESDETCDRHRQGRHNPADDGSGGDAERYGEDGVGHRDEATYVEMRGLEPNLVDGRVPPCDDRRDGAAPDGGGQDRPADL